MSASPRRTAPRPSRCSPNSWTGSSRTCRSGNAAALPVGSSARLCGPQPAGKPELGKQRSRRYDHSTKRWPKSVQTASRCRLCACRWQKHLAACCAKRFARRKTCRHSTAQPATATRFLQMTPRKHFQVVDTLHAADWKPRQIESRRSRARGDRRGVAVRESARRDAGKCRAHRRPNPHRAPRDGGQHQFSRRRFAGGRAVVVQPARNWMPARWHCWRRRETPVRSSARDCASSISRPATKSFRRTRRRSPARSATAIRF